MTPSLLPYGDRAWLIDTSADPSAVADHLRGHWPHGAEIVLGARTCLVRFPGTAPDLATMVSALQGAPTSPRLAVTDTPVVTIRVRYDGEDLAEVADAIGAQPSEVVALHTTATYRVAFLGFAPGFGYLTGLPRRLHLPRRRVPRVRVPAGAVAVADAYSAVYPSSSPGGWHLLGTTEEWLFDVHRDPPARLRAGAHVRFEAIR